MDPFTALATALSVAGNTAKIIDAAYTLHQNYTSARENMTEVCLGMIQAMWDYQNISTLDQLSIVLGSESTSCQSQLEVVKRFASANMDSRISRIRDAWNQPQVRTMQQELRNRVDSLMIFITMLQTSPQQARQDIATPPSPSHINATVSNSPDFHYDIALEGVQSTADVDRRPNLLKKLGSTESSRRLVAAASVGNCASMYNEIKSGARVDYCRKSEGEWRGMSAIHVAVLGRYENAVRMLLHYKANVNAVIPGSITPLHIAVAVGDVEMVKLLLSSKANPDFRDASGQTPLFKASDEITELLLSRIYREPATATLKDHQSNTPLHYASRYGRIRSVKALIDSGALGGVRNRKDETPLWCVCNTSAADDLGDRLEIITALSKQKGFNTETLNYPTRQGKETPLHAAVKQKQLEIVKKLLSFENINVKARDHNGEAPLHYAAKLMSPLILQELVRRYEADEREYQSESEKKTALHHAVCSGSIECAEALLKAGVRVNVKTVDGFSPIHYAVQLSSKVSRQMARLLIKYNAEPGCSIDDNDGISAVRSVIEGGVTTTSTSIKSARYATASEHMIAAMVNNNKTCLNDLLLHGIAPNAEPRAERQPLCCAARMKREDFVRLLLNHGASIDAEDASGRTALLYAVGSGDEHMVDLLLLRGANPNARDFDGSTALMNAVSCQHRPCVRSLINHSANVEVKDPHGRTALFYAVDKADAKTVDLLLSKDASVMETETRFGFNILEYMCRDESIWYSRRSPTKPSKESCKVLKLLLRNVEVTYRCLESVRHWDDQVLASRVLARLPRTWTFLYLDRKSDIVTGASYCVGVISGYIPSKSTLVGVAAVASLARYAIDRRK